MAYKDYSNFVRPSNISSCYPPPTGLTGEEARKLYLEEVKDAGNVKLKVITRQCSKDSRNRIKNTDIHLTDRDLFLSAQSNDKDTLRKALDSNPDKLNVIDDYGWSLLMIACQANSVEVVKELLRRGIDTSVRDKAGNSANTLVIKNKNTALASILLENKVNNPPEIDTVERHRPGSSEEVFICNICNNKKFPNKQEHLSSTLHNINASKGRKIPVNFAIPESNRGYQIMLKVGWDKESGLGRDGCGKKYPIKAVQKKDRKGLGHMKNEKKIKEEFVKHVNRKTFKRDYYNNRKKEISFRREFY